jgi:YHS domain-containing protein
MRSVIRLFVLLAVAAGLAGCSAMRAQNPSSDLKPVNAVADGNDERVMLKGHDVVAYRTMGRHALGSPQFSSRYQEVTFRFVNAEHKAMFDREPAKYLPEYGGYCANGISYGIPWGGDADSWKITDGKLYIFGGQGSKDAYLLDEARNRALADQYWKTEVAGSNSFFQRTKRLILRVPHYKSGDELAREVAAAKAKG